MNNESEFDIDQSFVQRALSQSILYKREFQNNKKNTENVKNLLEEDYSTKTVQIYRKEAESPKSNQEENNQNEEESTIKSEDIDGDRSE